MVTNPTNSQEEQVSQLDPPATRPERLEMVATQIRARGVRDPGVLRAVERIPREWFVPQGLQHLAYADKPLSIGHGQTISQPYMVAEMAACLELTGDETVLEVGAGSGYGAAILSLLAARVVAVERIPALLEEAKRRWHRLGLGNIHGVLGDGTLGVPEMGPYDAISVTAGAPSLPDSLVAQLVPGRGRMVIPLGGAGLQTLSLVRKNGEGKVGVTSLFGCIFVPLVGKEGWPGGG